MLFDLSLLMRRLLRPCAVLLPGQDGPLEVLQQDFLCGSDALVDELFHFLHPDGFGDAVSVREL